MLILDWYPLGRLKGPPGLASRAECGPVRWWQKARRILGLGAARWRRKRKTSLAFTSMSGAGGALGPQGAVLPGVVTG